MKVFALIFVLSASHLVRGQEATPSAPSCSAFVDDDVPGGQRNLTGAAFSPNGKRIVTASEFGLARVWDKDTKNKTATCWQRDAITDRVIGRKKGNLTWVRDSQFSPDGHQVVSVGPNGNAWIWNVGDGNCKGRVVHLTGHSEDVRTAQFSPDGKKIVTTSDDTTVKIWNAKTGKLLRDVDLSISSRPTAFTTSAQFSPDGKRVIATRSDGYMTLIDVATGKKSELRHETADNMAIWQARFSPDGKTLATASEDGEIALSDLKGNQLKLLRAPAHPPTAGVNSVAFSPDGRFVISGLSDGSVRMYQVSDGKEVGALTVSPRSISRVEFSPNGKEFVTSSPDGTASLCQVPPPPRSTRPGASEPEVVR